MHLYSLKQLESTSESVKPHHQLKKTVSVDSSVGNHTTFLITWQAGGPPDIVLSDPHGRRYYTRDFITNLPFQTACLLIPGITTVGTVSLFIMAFGPEHDFQLNLID